MLRASLPQPAAVLSYWPGSPPFPTAKESNHHVRRLQRLLHGEFVGQPLLRAPDSEQPLRVSPPTLGARRRGATDSPDPRRAPPRGVHHAVPVSAATWRRHRPGAAQDRPARGAVDRRRAVPHGPDQHRPPTRGPVARHSQPERLGGDADHRAAASALAVPQVQRHPPVLLPGGGGRDRNLAHRGGSEESCESDHEPPPESGRGKSRRESGSCAPRAQDGHGSREDDGHGHADRLADDQRREAPQQPAVHARVPGRDPRDHHPRPFAGAPAQRPGRLLRETRADPQRDAPGPQPGQDRDHQLPRVQAAGARIAAEGEQGAAEGPDRRPLRRPRRPRGRCCSG